jgi:hypothetical protein
MKLLVIKATPKDLEALEKAKRVHNHSTASETIRNAIFAYSNLSPLKPIYEEKIDL